ncbi:MAG: CHC2 zinc finger domain-containing protein, partial [Spirochaetota bacterium]|nr:CHC2 zinc finger domain-containing protein [Spirochaetota bacterium]
MKIPDGTIEEINRNVNIVDVVADYVTLEKKGGRYMGLCPFHTEKTPSFSVTPDKNLFYCFGCHKGGNMFTFVMEMEHIPFQEAALKLARRAGIELNLDSSSREEQSQRQALSDLYNKLSGSFHYFLTGHAMGGEALKYLKARGVDEEIIEQFNLGFVPQKRSWLYDFLKGKNYSDEFLSQTGLFSRKYPESSLFNGRLVFPIYTAGGQVIAFGGRSIDGREPKYINSPETDLFK